MWNNVFHNIQPPKICCLSTSMFESCSPFYILRSYHCVILLNQVDGIFHEWEHKSKPPSTHQFSLLKPSQTSHWFLITPSCFVYQFKRGELPMAGDTWQILQRQFLHLLVAQALEGWQLVLGAERRFTSEVWVTVKCVSFTVEMFPASRGLLPRCWNLLDALYNSPSSGRWCLKHKFHRFDLADPLSRIILI